MKPAVSAAQRWRAIVERQRASGLGVLAFCRQNSIPSSSFFGWRRKLSGPDAGGGGRGAAAGPATFARVKVIAGPREAAGIEVRLRGGRRLVLRAGFDAQLLLRAVAALEGLA